MKTEYIHFYGVKAEIMDYLRSHPENKNTLTQMAKAGGVRATSVSKSWLRKHLNELEEMGFIYSTKVKDPIGKIEFTYYTVVPKCAEEGALGVPNYVSRNQRFYTSLIQSFYTSLSEMYLPLISNYCDLCVSFKKTLRKELGCSDFIRIYQSLIKNDLNKLKDLELKMVETEELETDINQWLESKVTPPPIFLEDWTIALIGYTTYYGYETACANCKYKQKCLREGHKWVSGFLETYLAQTRESDLTKFWKSIVSGVPKIKIALLQKYFASRFNFSVDHNPFFFLKMYEETKSLPYFYSKAIPLSLVLLIEDRLIPMMKKFAEIPRRKL